MPAICMQYYVAAFMPHAAHGCAQVGPGVMAVIPSGLERFLTPSPVPGEVARAPAAASPQAQALIAALSAATLPSMPRDLQIVLLPGSVRGQVAALEGAAPVPASYNLSILADYYYVVEPSSMGVTTLPPGLASVSPQAGAGPSLGDCPMRISALHARLTHLSVPAVSLDVEALSCAQVLSLSTQQLQRPGLLRNRRPRPCTLVPPASPSLQCRIPCQGQGRSPRTLADRSQHGMCLQLPWKGTASELCPGRLSCLASPPTTLSYRSTRA